MAPVVLVVEKTSVSIVNKLKTKAADSVVPVCVLRPETRRANGVSSSLNLTHRLSKEWMRSPMQERATYRLSVFSLLIPRLISFRNTLTDTSRKMFSQISGHPSDLIQLTHRRNLCRNQL